LPPEIKQANHLKPQPEAFSGTLELKKAEAQVLIDTLKKFGGHRAKTARELGMNTSTLWRKMKKLGIAL